MAGKSTIEWTDDSWNPVVGCTKISEGCRNCYAERNSWRQRNMARKADKPSRRDYYLDVIDDRARWTNKVRLVEEALDDPYSWRKPRAIFVNSMSDLFHVDVPLGYIKRVFEVMQGADWHTYQILTKRSERLRQVHRQLPWPQKVWMGVSIEDASVMYRLRDLVKTGAAIKWLSLEPLLGPLPNLDIAGIDWVVAGGESGPGARPMQGDWVREIRDQCVDAGVPFFFKQWGKLVNNPDASDPTAKENGGKSKGGRMLDGRIWDEMPVTP